MNKLQPMPMRSTGIAILTVGLVLFSGLLSTLKANETLGFGVAAGRTGGSGFSLRRMPMEGFGWQTGGIYLKSTDMTYFNYGYEHLYVLNHTNNTCLYVAAGLSYSYERTEEENWIWNNINGRYESEITHPTSKGFAGGLGAGVSFRYAQWEQIWFSADLLLTADDDTVLPSPQCAVHYFFR